MSTGSDFSTLGFSPDRPLTSRSALVKNRVGPVSHLKHFVSHTGLLPSWKVAWHHLEGPGCTVSQCEVFPDLPGVIRVRKTVNPTSPQDGKVSGPPGAAHTQKAWAFWRPSLRTHVVPIRHALRSVRLSTTYHYWQSTLPSNLGEPSLGLRIRLDWKHWVWRRPSYTATAPFVVKCVRFVKIVSPSVPWISQCQKWVCLPGVGVGSRMGRLAVRREIRIVRNTVVHTWKLLGE